MSAIGSYYGPVPNTQVAREGWTLQPDRVTVIGGELLWAYLPPPDIPVARPVVRYEKRPVRHRSRVIWTGRKTFEEDNSPTIGDPYVCAQTTHPKRVRHRSYVTFTGQPFFPGFVPPILSPILGVEIIPAPRSRSIPHTTVISRWPLMLYQEQTEEFLKTTVTPGHQVRHRAKTLLIGPPPQISERTTTELNASLLMTRVYAGGRVRHRSVGRVLRLHGLVMVRRYGVARGLFRVWNWPEYRLYRKQDDPPVESDTPFATAPSLPSTPADTFGDGQWYLAAGYYNGIYDSGFGPQDAAGRLYRRLTIDGGQETGLPPKTPDRVALQLRRGGIVRVTATYAENGALRAEEWAIAYTTDGSDPAEDSPDVTRGFDARGAAVLGYELPAQPNGTVVRVRVQVRRNDGADDAPVWVYSLGSEVLSATADAEGPAGPEGGGALCQT
jgi:hypothetical protein